MFAFDPSKPVADSQNKLVGLAVTETELSLLIGALHNFRPLGDLQTFRNMKAVAEQAETYYFGG